MKPASAFELIYENIIIFFFFQVTAAIMITIAMLMCHNTRFVKFFRPQLIKLSLTFFAWILKRDGNEDTSS